VTRRPLLLLAALLAAGCVTGGRLRAQADSVGSETEKARKAGAMRCAPRELAAAEAHADFALREMDAGNGSRAQEHLNLAEAAAHKAVELSKDCVQRVVVRQPVPLPPPPVPKPVIIKTAPVDTDGDGIPDDIDRCPLDPEDKDGFQDEDGCPDPDNDGDGIVDAMDACPNNPGPLENRGCPVQKYTLVEVKKGRIEIRQQVKFATGKFAILPASFGLLDQVVQVLIDNPGMRIRIEGHTDSVGREKMNLALSQKRADSVKGYLIKKGIELKRLQSRGFGPTRPIASNKTEKGRAQNRRTDFVIVSTE
jgi:OmpA-OmpF porin, OOP family